MKTSYTSGPWQVSGFIDGNPRVVANGDAAVAHVRGEFSCPGASMANAHLIAASPELLEAAERLMEHYAHCLPDHMTNEIRAVIAKAKGQP